MAVGQLRRAAGHWGIGPRRRLADAVGLRRPSQVPCLGSLALAPELAFLVVAVVAVPACFLAGYAATRVPGVSKVL